MLTSAIRRLTGLPLLLSAALFLVWSVLELLLGSPPADGAEILDWLLARQTLLAFVNETLFFAAMFLLPVPFCLHRWLSRDHPSAAMLGAGSVCVAISLLVVSLIVHGRLVFPIFGLRVHTPEIAELVVAIYYAGLHAVYVVMAGAALAVGIATRGSRRALSAFGFVTVACDLMAAYPDALGPSLTFAARVPFAAWVAIVGSVASGEVRRRTSATPGL